MWKNRQTHRQTEVKTTPPPNAVCVGKKISDGVILSKLRILNGYNTLPVAAAWLYKSTVSTSLRDPTQQTKPCGKHKIRNSETACYSPRQKRTRFDERLRCDVQQSRLISVCIRRRPGLGGGMMPGTDAKLTSDHCLRACSLLVSAKQQQRYSARKKHPSTTRMRRARRRQSDDDGGGGEEEWIPVRY